MRNLAVTKLEYNRTDMIKLVNKNSATALKRKEKVFCI